MKDWKQYIRQCFATDLWGLVCLDYYYRVVKGSARPDPSEFINEILEWIGTSDVDPVAFHNVLLCLCVQLLGIDFDAIIEKSIRFVKPRLASLSDDQLRQIINHYSVYRKAGAMRDEINSLRPTAPRIGMVEQDKGTPSPTTIGGRNQPTDVVDAVESGNMSNSEIPGPGEEGFDEPLAQPFLKDPFKHMPLLRYYSQDGKLKDLLPFAGKRALFILHFLRDLIPFVKASIALGLDPNRAIFFYKNYPYPQRQAIAQWLAKTGFRVLPVSQVALVLGELAKLTLNDAGEILIVEDGGYIVPRIHGEFPRLIPYTIGAVEQTTRGIRNSEEWEAKSGKKLGIPVLSIATSKMKNEFEPPFIAKATVRSMSELLTGIALNGKKVAVLGCGTIGRKLIEWLRTNGAEVTCYEIEPEKSLWLQQEGIPRAESAAEASKSKSFVFGTTGTQSIDSRVIASLMHNCHLISTSSEQYEIDLEELDRLAVRKERFVNDEGRLVGTDIDLPPDDRRIHLVANGYPINFWGMNSMPEEASDVIMTLILLASAEVAAGKCTKNGIDPDTVNDLARADRYNIAGKFLEIHKQG